MHNKSKYIILDFLLMFLFLTFHPIFAAKESSVFDLGVGDRDIYAKDQSITISYDLWIGKVDPSEDDFTVTFDVSSLTGANLVILYLRLWERNTDSDWASYGGLNWSTNGASSDPLEVSWYSIIPPSLASNEQKLDFLASTEDNSIWEAEISLEISIIAAFVTEGWIYSPQKLGSAPVISPGFEVWGVMSSLGLVIIFLQKKRH